MYAYGKEAILFQCFPCLLQCQSAQPRWWLAAMSGFFFFLLLTQTGAHAHDMSLNFPRTGYAPWIWQGHVLLLAAPSVSSIYKTSPGLPQGLNQLGQPTGRMLCMDDSNSRTWLRRKDPADDNSHRQKKNLYMYLFTFA